MQYQHLQQNIETSAKAPKKLKKQTFQKIDQLNTMFELLGFFVHAPKTLFDSQKDDTLNGK